MTHSINSLQGKLWKTILLVFAVLVVSYGVLRIIPILRGVKITTMQIQDNTSSENSVEIKGKAMHARSLSINGRAILMDPDGSFTDEVILVGGINKITLEAVDVRGKTHTKQMVMNGNVTDHPEIKPVSPIAVANTATDVLNDQETIINN
jgi:hypothetical protein